MNFLSSSPQIQRAFEALGITLLHSLWQGFLLMLLLWILLRFIRYKKANLRFILAFGSLMLIMLCFALTFYYEWDNLKPLPSVNQSFSTQAIGQPIALTDLQVTSDTSFWAQIKSETYAIFYQLAENAHLLAIAWLTGSLLFSFRLSLGLWQIHQLKREKQTLPEFWKTKSLEFQQRLGIRQNVEVCINNSLDSPLTLGWLKPMILFPASMLMAMPAEQIESILVHELAHIRRHDYLWNLLQSVAEVILFYHPAYWYIASVLEQEREHACDVITLMFTGRPQVYAQALLQVASLRTTLSTVGLSARGRGKGRSGFAERIRRIVAPQQKKKGVQPLPFLLSFCLIGFLLFAFTLKSPFEDQDTLTTQEISDPLYDSLRAPDYVDYRYRLFDEKSLPEMLDYSSMNDENYIIGKAASEAEPVDVREYFNTSAIFLLDGVIMQDPEQIHISDIRRYEVYHEPLPRALQNLSERPYSSVVRAFSQMPEEIRKSNHIRVGGQVFSSKNDMRIPLADVMVEVQSSGQKTTTNAQGRFSFPSVRKNDTILFHTPSYSKPTPVPVDGREYLGLYTYIPNSSKTAEKLLERLKDRVKPVEVKKTRGDIQESSSLPDSSMYDVMKDIILIDPKTNTAKINSNVPAPQDAPNTYYTIGDPEVLFTLDGVVTDPRTVDRTLVENASFETQNVPHGYLVEIKAISKEAAEAARKEQQKTVISGIVTDQKTGKPLPGTHIVVEGTTQGTIADLHGRYQIEIPQGSGELIFTYTGYETRTEVVHHRKTLEIAMSPTLDNETLNDKIIASGRVVDATSNKPLAGVEVFSMEKGEKIDDISTFTNQKGEYQVAVPADFKVLVHSKEGYLDYAVPIRYLTENKAEKWEVVMKKQSQVSDKANTPRNPLVQGQVVDANTGKGIPGVNVLVSGTTTGTVTNGGGRYLLKLTDDAQSLSFNARGYQKQQIAIDGNVMLNVNLLPSEASQTPKNQDSILFIIDDEVRDDIKSLKELDEKFSHKSPHSISIQPASTIDPSEVPSVSAAKLKQYARVVIIDTYGSGTKSENIARGRVIDERTKKPLAGVEVSSLNDEKLKTYTDKNGEYALPLNAETKYLQHRLDGYMPFVIESKITATFENPIVMPLKIDEASNNPAPSERKIEGQIVDAKTGQGIPGANVLIKGTTTGTVTDMEGRYKLKLTEDAKMLSITFIGYEKKEVSISNASRIELQNQDQSSLPIKPKASEQKSESSIRIMGKVTDGESGNSLQGAEIFSGRKYIGKVTHPTGIFTAPVHSLEDTLTFRLEGYSAVSIPLAGRQKIDVVLKKPSLHSSLGDSILFIVDGLPVKDINSINLGADEIKTLDVIRGETAARFLTAAQGKKYNGVVLITTKNSKANEPERSAMPGRIQGKVVDERTGEPLEGVEITDIKSKQVLAISDQDGEYVFTLKQPEQKRFLKYELQGYARYVLSACSNCYLSPTAPSVLVLPIKPEENADKFSFEDPLKVFPNPGNDEIKISFALPEAGSVVFELLDKEGNSLYKKEEYYNISENHETVIPSENFRPDTYLLKITRNGESVVKRVILK